MFINPLVALFASLANLNIVSTLVSITNLPVSPFISGCKCLAIGLILLVILSGVIYVAGRLLADSLGVIIICVKSFYRNVRYNSQGSVGFKQRTIVHTNEQGTTADVIWVTGVVLSSWLALFYVAMRSFNPTCPDDMGSPMLVYRFVVATNNYSGVGVVLGLLMGLPVKIGSLNPALSWFLPDNIINLVTSFNGCVTLNPCNIYETSCVWFKHMRLVYEFCPAALYATLYGLMGHFLAAGPLVYYIDVYCPEYATVETMKIIHAACHMHFNAFRLLPCFLHGISGPTLGFTNTTLYLIQTSWDTQCREIVMDDTWLKLLPGPTRYAMHTAECSKVLNPNFPTTAASYITLILSSAL